MLYLMTVLMLIVVFLGMVSLEEEILSFQVASKDSVQSVSVWEDKKGRFHVFLPSYAKLEDIRVDLHRDGPVSINGRKLTEGMTCIPFSEEKIYQISYTAWGRQRSKEIVFLRSENIAAMYISTQSGSMDFIHKEKGNQESGCLALYLPDGTLAYSGEISSIQGHGNSTWTGYEKKPYSIHLTETADLLGLGSAQNWILLANARDPSQMRNKVIYDFAEQVGMQYTPGSDWVDLYVNGEYAGLYLLSERNEVHPERVDISAEGSFLVSMEMQKRIMAQNYPYISTASNQYLRVHYPDDPTPSQLKRMEETWQSLENAILAQDGTDPRTEKSWQEPIDMDSWVKKYLLEEIFGNADACYLSQFFYCNGEGKLYAGPAWDYDLSMGLKSVWQLTAPNGLYANRPAAKEGYATPWFHSLCKKDAFHQRMVELYRKDYLPLLNGFLNEHIQTCSGRIARAFALNQIRWGLEQTDIRKEAEYLQHFMQERIVFLNRIWLGGAPYYLVQADNAMGGNYGWYAVCPGETLTTLPVLQDPDNWSFLGWYSAATGEPFSFAEPVKGDAHLYAKWESKPALWLGRFAVITPILVLGISFGMLLHLDFRRNRTKQIRKG